MKTDQLLEFRDMGHAGMVHIYIRGGKAIDVYHGPVERAQLVYDSIKKLIHESADRGARGLGELVETTSGRSRKLFEKT